MASSARPRNRRSGLRSILIPREWSPVLSRGRRRRLVDHDLGVQLRSVEDIRKRKKPDPSLGPDPAVIVLWGWSVHAPGVELAQGMHRVPGTHRVGAVQLGVGLGQGRGMG